MWTRINEEVDALVQYRRGIRHPILKAIHWKGRKHTIVGAPEIASDGHSIYYDARDRSSRFALRFDIERLRWTLEGIDDSGVLHVGRDIPPPRVFPPPGWH